MKPTPGANHAAGYYGRMEIRGSSCQCRRLARNRCAHCAIRRPSAKEASK